MGDRRLIQRKRLGEIADADLVVAGSERREHGKAIRVRDGFQQAGGRVKVPANDRCRGTAALY